MRVYVGRYKTQNKLDMSEEELLTPCEEEFAFVDAVDGQEELIDLPIDLFKSCFPEVDLDSIEPGSNGEIFHLTLLRKPLDEMKDELKTWQCEVCGEEFSESTSAFHSLGAGLRCIKCVLDKAEKSRSSID